MLNVLHYTENNQQCKAGDLILIDAGTECTNYSILELFLFQVNIMTIKESIQCRSKSKNGSNKDADSRTTLETIPYRSR
jgi:hypothetical protein